MEKLFFISSLFPNSLRSFHMHVNYPLGFFVHSLMCGDEYVSAPSTHEHSARACVLCFENELISYLLPLPERICYNFGSAFALGGGTVQLSISMVRVGCQSCETAVVIWTFWGQFALGVGRHNGWGRGPLG
jgi:hypothetical protein